MSSPPLASLSQLLDCGFVPLAQNKDAEIFFYAARVRLSLRVTTSDGNLVFEYDLPDSGEKFAVRFCLNECDCCKTSQL